MDIVGMLATWWLVIIVGVLGATYVAFARSAVAELIVRLAARLYGSDPNDRARRTEEWVRNVEDLKPSERPAYAGSLLWVGIRDSVVRLPGRQSRTDTPDRHGSLLEMGTHPMPSEMASPFVRRLRLAAEFRELRMRLGLSPGDLAKAVGVSRAHITRLERGYVVDQVDIIKILKAVGVDKAEWAKLITIARDAGARGWWESYTDMGERQALYANLEVGATDIREFHMTLIPGLLQTPAYTRSRIHALLSTRTRVSAIRNDGIVEARQIRQRMLRRPGGPRYEVILDELVIRRPTVTAEVLKEQIEAIASRAETDSRTTVRVLPIDARIENYMMPRSAFSLYAFSDPYDPTIVAVDAVTEDRVFANSAEVQRYEDLYDSLHAASLPPEASIHLLIECAQGSRMPGGRRPRRGSYPTSRDLSP